MLIAALVFPLLFQGAPAPARLIADLDGDGVAETVTAVRHGKNIRLDVVSAAGKRLARVEAPAPSDPVSDLSLSAGSLGSAGALVELAAVGKTEECRSVWRLRSSGFARVPAIGSSGTLADCFPTSQWTFSWRKSSEGKPDDYARERTRPAPEGVFHRTEIYRFAGFQLELDPARSTAQIGGIDIPNWFPAILYAKPSLESLASNFDLSPLRTNPRLRFVTDQEEGVFALRIDRPSGERRFPITSAQAGKERNEWILRAGSGSDGGQVLVYLGADGRSPLEARIPRWPDGLQGVFAAVSRSARGAPQIFASAEDEVGMSALRGTWDSDKGERIAVAFVSEAPAVVDFGKSRVYLSIPHAPAGSDLLLIPTDGSVPQSAVTLRGPDVFDLHRVTCSEGPPAQRACRLETPATPFHRLGAARNVH